MEIELDESLVRPNRRRGNGAGGGGNRSARTDRRLRELASQARCAPERCARRSHARVQERLLLVLLFHRRRSPRRGLQHPRFHGARAESGGAGARAKRDRSEQRAAARPERDGAHATQREVPIPGRRTLHDLRGAAADLPQLSRNRCNGMPRFLRTAGKHRDRSRLRSARVSNRRRTRGCVLQHSAAAWL